MSQQITERRSLYAAEFERNGRSLPAFREMRK